MFEVSWEDPERETVGERKIRTQKRSACSPRNGPRIPSQPSSKASSRTTSRKSALSRSNQSRSSSRSSSTIRVNGTTAARKQSTCSCMTSSDSPFHETPRTSTTTLPESSFFSDSYHSEDENSEASSTLSNSTWSLSSTSITSGKLIQQLSPTSFVTRSTEITVSPREMVRDAEQVAIRVHISASGAVHTSDSPSRRAPQAAVLDFLNDNEVVDDNWNHGEMEIVQGAQPLVMQRKGSVPWVPPETWGYSPSK